MLAECRTHGYFREERCPLCGDEGKFLLNSDEVDMVGRMMAGVLRHFPERFNLKLDANGWVDLRTFLDGVAKKNRRLRFLRPHHIIGLIETDPKGRYQYSEGRIRATYGHTLDLDLDLPTENIPDTLYYPTSQAGVDEIQSNGLKPMDRKMVHLSRTYEAALEAGRVKITDPIILEIDAKAARMGGNVIMKAGKTVYLTREVPPEYLHVADRVEEELPSG